MVRHDDEVGDGGAGEKPVKGKQGGFHGLAVRKQLWARLLVQEPRQDSGASLRRDGDEEELPPAVVEVQSHVGEYRKERALRQGRGRCLRFWVEIG